MAARLAHSASISLILAGMFLALFAFPQTSLADTAYGDGPYGDGLYGGVDTPDTTDPSISLTAPANGATVSGNVAVSASASDNIAVAGVSFFADGVRIGSEDTTSTYGVVLDSTALSNGVHALVASARDTSNNYATSSAISITVANDEDEDSGGGGGGNASNNNLSSNTDTSSSSNTIATAITNLVLQNRDLFLAAQQQGITISPFILQILTGNSGNSAASTSYARDLTRGSTGADVRALQVYLNSRGHLLATVGPGSPGQETNFFGPATQAALARFQQVTGITPAAGYFGPKTRAYIATH